MFFCVHFQTFFVDFSCEITEKALKWTKKVEKRLKKCFDQLLSVRSTQKLVKIHNIHFTKTNYLRAKQCNAVLLETRKDLRTVLQTSYNNKTVFPCFYILFEKVQLSQYHHLFILAIPQRIWKTNKHSSLSSFSGQTRQV